MIETKTSEEELAVRSICALASALESLMCYGEGVGLSRRAIIILDRAYLQLKAAVDTYFPEPGNPLCYQGAPRGAQFKRTSKGEGQ